MKRPNFISAILFLLAYNNALGTVIIPTTHLGNYAEYSDIVGLYHFDYEEDRYEDGRIYTYLVFSLQDALKGEEQQIEIRQMSYMTSADEGFMFDVHIDMEPGKEYLLFLSKVHSHYFPGLCNYGIFELAEHNGEEVLVPTKASTNAAVLDRPDGQSVEVPRPYYYDDLKEAIDIYLTGSPWPKELNEVDGFRMEDFHKAPTGCVYLGAGGGNVGARWVNSNIDSYTDDDGDDDLANVEQCIDNALDAINNNYNVFLMSSGTTDYNPSCASGSATDGYPSYANTNLSGPQTLLHIFNDPCSEIADLSGCSGTLAIGGLYFGGGNVFNGDNWYNAQHGYAIYNNGLGACYGCGNYEIVATHESTHALGMGHLSASSYPGNNMNPSCCNNINTKDIECMDHAYLASVPIELEYFQAELRKSSAIVSWGSLSELNCDRYVLEKSRDGRGNWIQIHEEGCAVLSLERIEYEFEDRSLYPGDNYYRLMQEDIDGTRTYFDIVNVRYTGTEDWHVSYESGSIQLVSESERLVGSRVSLFNTSGQTLYSGIISSANHDLGINTRGNQGIFFLRSETENGVETRKIFVY